MLYIYIVSLRQDVEKRSVVSKTLQDFGLNFSFIDAVYGKSLSDDVLDSIRDKSKGTALNRRFLPTAGEIGCTLSHLIAYQKILDNDLEWACILEDDVILDKRFKTFITTFKATGLNPETLYLLGGQNGATEAKIVKSIKNTKIIGQQKFSKIIRSEGVIYRTCCYLMSSHLAEELIRLSKTDFIIADDWNYLVKNNFIKNIYLSSFVDHPLGLSNSHLQKERELALLNKSLSNSQGKNIYF